MQRAATAIAVLLLGLALGYAVWHTVSQGSNRQAAHSPAHGFGPAERHAFSVLHGPTRRVPLALQNHLRRARNQRIRSIWLNVARYVPVDAGLWVANGRGETCIIQAHGGAVSCVSRATLIETGVALGVVKLGPPPDHKPQEFGVVGLVPNGVKTVVVKVGKKRRLLAVRNNSYSLRASFPIEVTRLER